MKYMSYRSILPIILTALLINALYSHGQPLRRFFLSGSWGTEEDSIGLVPPDSYFERPISDYAITDVCITDESTNGEDSGSQSCLPEGTKLISTRPSVASVMFSSNGTSIHLHQPGSTILQLCQEASDERPHRAEQPNDSNNKVFDQSGIYSKSSTVADTVIKSCPPRKVLASYALVVTPVPPGTLCDSNLLDFEDPKMVDCSQQCMSAEEMIKRFGDGDCDDGRPRNDKRLPIDLSCFYIPANILGIPLESAGDFLGKPDVSKAFIEVEMFDEHLKRTDAASQNINISFGPSFDDPDPINGIDTYIRLRLDTMNDFTKPPNRDGGDCSPEKSCKAQFETVPGFEFCNASAGTCTFSFNAANRRSTCTSMCQRFGASCVAALNNHPAGCDTVDLSEIDTCNTPRHSEICVCERR